MLLLHLVYCLVRLERKCFVMSRFMFEGERNPGDGSRNPLDRKFRRALFNIKVKFTQDQFKDSRTVEKIRRL